MLNCVLEKDGDVLLPSFFVRRVKEWIMICSSSRMNSGFIHG